MYIAETQLSGPLLTMQPSALSKLVSSPPIFGERIFANRKHTRIYSLDYMNYMQSIPVEPQLSDPLLTSPLHIIQTCLMSPPTFEEY